MRLGLRLGGWRPSRAAKPADLGGLGRMTASGCRLAGDTITLGLAQKRRDLLRPPTHGPAFPQVPLSRIAYRSYCTTIVEDYLYGYNMMYSYATSDCTLMSNDVEDRS
jgi:hypothetical protein